MSTFNLFEDFEAFGIREGHLQSALQDAWMDYSACGDISMREFFAERRKTHPHRYNTFTPTDDNPEHAAFFSLAAQGAYLREHGEAATRELLASQGMKLGQVRPPAKVDAETIKGSTNPYSPQWKGTEAQREARIASLINSGTSLASSLARAANRTIDNKPLQLVGAARLGKR
jgi:hypothetical protein